METEKKQNYAFTFHRLFSIFFYLKYYRIECFVFFRLGKASHMWRLHDVKFEQTNIRLLDFPLSTSGKYDWSVNIFCNRLSDMMLLDVVLFFEFSYLLCFLCFKFIVYVVCVYMCSVFYAYLSTGCWNFTSIHSKWMKLFRNIAYRTWKQKYTKQCWLLYLISHSH